MFTGTGITKPADIISEKYPVYAVINYPHGTLKQRKRYVDVLSIIFIA